MWTRATRPQLRTSKGNLRASLATGMESSAKTYQSASENVTASPHETLRPAFELFRKKWIANDRPTSVQNAKNKVQRDQCFERGEDILIIAYERRVGECLSILRKMQTVA